MRVDLEREIVRAEWRDKLFFPELRDYVDNVIKKYALLTSAFSTGLGVIFGNPNLMYLGASIYQAQIEV